MKRLILAAMMSMVVCASWAATYKLNGGDDMDKSSFAAGAKKGVGSGWVNVDDSSDMPDFPAAGNDYLVDGCELRTPNKGYDYTFAGDSLTIRMDLSTGSGGIGHKTTSAKLVTIPRFILENGRYSIANSGETWSRLGGTVLIPEGYKGFFGCSGTSTDDRRLRVESDISGSGTLILATTHTKVLVDLQAANGNAGFTGPVMIDGDGINYSSSVKFQNVGGGVASIATAASWFGNPESFLAEGLTINYGGQLKFSETIESTGPNRGFTIKNKAGTINVADGKSVTIDAPIASTVGFKKIGTGTLVLAAASPDLTSEATVTVSEGSLRLAADNALGAANVNLAGATLLVNPVNGPVAMSTAPSGLTKLTIEAGEVETFKTLPLFTIPSTEQLNLAAIDWRTTSTFDASLPVDILSLQAIVGDDVTTIAIVRPELDAPKIEAEFVSATETEATFSVTVGYVTETISDPLTVTAYYGSANGGVAHEHWEHDLVYETPMAPGTYSLTVPLASGVVNSIAFTARRGEGEEIWTAEPFSVAVAVHALTLPESAWEDAAGPVELIATRVRGGTVETLELSFEGADGKLDAETLPAEVSFAEDETEVRLPLKLVDNAAKDGDRQVSVSLVGTPSCLIGSNGTATMTVKDDESVEAAERVWTGAAGDHDWDNIGNWKNGVRPTAFDVAIFPDAAVVANEKIVIAADRAVRKLVIDKVAKNFSIEAGADGGSLAVKEIVDTGADEATVMAVHVLRVPLAFAFSNERGALVEVTNDKAKLALGDFTGCCDVIKTGAGRVDFEPSAVNSFRDHKVVIADGTLYSNPANRPDARLQGMTFVLDKREHDVRIWFGASEHKGNFRIEDIPGKHQAVYKHDGGGHTFYQSWVFTGPVLMELNGCNLNGSMTSESDVTLDLAGNGVKFGSGAVDVAGEIVIRRGTLSFQDNMSGKRSRPQTIVLGCDDTPETEGITLGFGNKMDAFDNWSIRVNNVGREVACARAGNYKANRTRAATIELARDVNIRCENTYAGYGDIYTGVISGVGGVTVKSSAASFVRMQAANTYAGKTTITQGVCQAAANGCFSTNDVIVANGARLAYVLALAPDEKGFVNAIDDAATLELATGATNSFETAVTEVVGRLKIDGVRQPGGLYGSLDNEKATVKVGWITGNGLLKVRSGGLMIIMR